MRIIIIGILMRIIIIGILLAIIISGCDFMGGMDTGYHQNAVREEIVK